MAYQTGAEHYLMLAYTGPTAPQVTDTQIKVDGTNKITGATSAPKDLTLVEAPRIRDVNVGSAAATIDSTTRESARAGFTSNIPGPVDADFTVQFVWEPRDDTGAIIRPDLEILQYCAAAKKTIWVCDFDKPITKLGAQGLAANWRVSWSNPKPVADLVTWDVTFLLETNPQIIVVSTVDDGSGTVAEFQAIVDP